MVDKLEQKFLFNFFLHLLFVLQFFLFIKRFAIFIFLFLLVAFDVLRVLPGQPRFKIPLVSVVCFVFFRSLFQFNEHLFAM